MNAIVSTNLIKDMSWLLRSGFHIVFHDESSGKAVCDLLNQSNRRYSLCVFNVTMCTTLQPQPIFSSESSYLANSVDGQDKQL